MYPQGQEKKLDFIDRHWKPSLICLIVLFVAVILLAPTNVDLIHSHLEQQGISYEGIEFTRTDDKMVTRYRSSKPIDMMDGGPPVEYWDIVDVGFSARYFSLKVYPYPRRSPKTISIQLAAWEYAELVDIYGEDNLEEWITTLILDTIIYTGEAEK